jgi:anti-sigma factor RsiW
MIWIPGGRAGDRAKLAARPLTCREALDRLYEYLDGELGGAWDERVARHIDDCPPCRSRFRFERSFLDAVAAAGRVPGRSPLVEAPISPRRDGR